MESRNDQVVSPLRFIDYYVDLVQFDRNPDFNEEPVKISFKIASQFEHTKDENNTTYVTLDVKIFENAKENNYPFSLRLKLVGIFEIEPVEEHFQLILSEKNAVAILFPYLRALVTTYTANSNIQPLILPPINIHKLLDRSSEVEENRA